jgi:hypothetical protein
MNNNEECHNQWTVNIAWPKPNEEEKYSVNSSALVANLLLTDPMDIEIVFGKERVTANYFIPEFIIGLFKATQLLLYGSKVEEIILSLSTEKNRVEFSDDQFTLHLWCMETRAYKNIQCEKDEYFHLLFLIKKEFEEGLGKIYHLSNVKDYHLFHIGFFNLVG